MKKEAAGSEETVSDGSDEEFSSQDLSHLDLIRLEHRYVKKYFYFFVNIFNFFYC